MAGLLDGMFGGNPMYQGFDARRNAIGQFGAGLMKGKNWQEGLALGGAGAMQGRQQDDAYATAQKAEADRLNQINSTVEYMRQKGFDDLVSGVEGGGLDIGTAWAEALRRGQPGYGQAESPKPMEINGQLVDPTTGQVLGDYRDQNSGMGNAPSGYQWNPDGTQAFIPGGPADPANTGKVTEAQRRNQQLASVIQPELAAVEQNWSELASGGNQAGGMVPGLGNALTSPGYQQASNSLATIAQSYLYSVSGAAATDAEVRKIVDSVTPRPFESQASIDAKLARIRQMADAVIQAGGAGGASSPAAPNTTSSGLTWSIEP